MVKLVITAPARRDLKGIFKEIARKGRPETARNYVRKLREKCLIVAHNTKAFRERVDISKGLRVFPVGNYVILYRTRGGAMPVTRIVHAALDITKDLD